VKLAIAGAIALAVIAAYPPTRYVSLALLGRGQGCPAANAARIESHHETVTRYKDEILAASKLVETDPAGFKLYETPMGRYWIPKGSEFVLPFNLAEEKSGIYFDGAHDIRPGDTVLDCGANVGVFTRGALAKGAAKVIAIEPGPENVECLRRNFKDEILAGRVVVYPKGVWNKDDELELNVDPENSAADSFVIKRTGARTVKVPLTTIDKLAAELNLSKIDFIKMDIEGAEPNALDGAAQALRRDKPRLSISAYHAADHPTLIPAKLRGARGDYSMKCGPCNAAGWTVRPDILYFN
jgi:FkbM family methyltransferase